MSKGVTKHLEALGVKIVYDDKVPKSSFPKGVKDLPGIPVPNGTVETANKVQVPADVAFWCAGNDYEGRVFDMLPSTPRGRLKVDKFLRCEGEKRVFAVGDIADVEGDRELATSGIDPQVAVVAENVIDLLGERSVKKVFKVPGFQPLVITVGPKKGVARLPFGLFTSGFFSNLKNFLGFFLFKLWPMIAGRKCPKKSPY